MATQGKKAELDKDGISYDFDKAELDKEGMTLQDEPGPESKAGAESSDRASEGEAGAPPVSGKRRLVIYGSLAAGIVLLLTMAGVLTYYLTKEDPKPAPVKVVKVTPPPSLDSPGGEIPLDPFLVLYKSGNPRESGVLLAQVRLLVNPKIAYNIGSNLFGIRSIIYQRLSENAEIYSKNELAAIIREDLKGLNVKDVSFVQFEKR